MGGESRGWTFINVSAMSGIKTAFAARKDYLAVIIDVAIDEQQLDKFLQYLRQSVAKYTLILVSPGIFSDSKVSELAQAGLIDVLKQNLSKTEEIQNELESRFDPKKRGHYDLNLLNCFVQATNDVIEYYIGELPAKGKAEIKVGRSVSTEFLTGIVQIQGNVFSGSASLSCNRKFVSLLASRIAGVSRGQALHDREIMMQVTKELCDQIFCKSGEHLSGMGMDFSITLPELFIGEGHTIVHQGKSPVLALPFDVGQNRLVIEFSLDKVEPTKA